MKRLRQRDVTSVSEIYQENFIPHFSTYYPKYCGQLISFSLLKYLAITIQYILRHKEILIILFTIRLSAYGNFDWLINISYFH